VALLLLALALLAVFDLALHLALGLLVLLLGLLGSSDTLLRVWETLPFNHWHYRDPFFFFLDLPAAERAMAIACLRGLPAFSSLRMLADTTFCEEPFTSGINDLALAA
jgi:hypothetical protein